MTTKEFADTFDFSEVFILRMKELYAGLDNQGLGPDEYGEWRIKCERMCATLMRRLLITDSTILDDKL